MVTNRKKRGLIRKTVKTINRIGKHVEKMQDIWNELPKNVQNAVAQSQNEYRSIPYCLRWLATGCTEYKEEEIVMVLREEGVI